MTLLDDATPRWIDLDGAVNARDLAGVPLTTGGTVAPGRLLRSDNLQDLTPRDVDHLVQDHGLSAVIDLRTGVEVRLEGPGPLLADERVVVEHRSLYPEAGEHTDVLEAETIVPWQNGVDGVDLPGESATVCTYLGYMHRRPDSIVAALATIAAPPRDGAALVHCAAGKDRTGLVVALALDVAGAPREAIVADYTRTSERIERIVRRLAGSPTYARDMVTDDPHHHAARPESMRRVLELLDERHGSPGGWLAAHGFEADAQEQLAVRLRGAA
jgi:protein tyrosine/serine phosphatase